jgi:hypothetical protein
MQSRAETTNEGGVAAGAVAAGGIAAGGGVGDADGPTPLGAWVASIDWRNYVVYIFFALVVAFFAVTIGDKGFLTVNNLFNIARNTAQLMVVAVALTFVISAASSTCRWAPRRHCRRSRLGLLWRRAGDLSAGSLRASPQAWPWGSSTVSSWSWSASRPS